jgi:hypothetical protein
LFQTHISSVNFSSDKELTAALQAKVWFSLLPSLLLTCSSRFFPLPQIQDVKAKVAPSDLHHALIYGLLTDASKAPVVRFAFLFLCRSLQLIRCSFPLLSF